MKILVADDHALMREGLRAVLSNRGHEVVGEATTGHEVIELVRRLKPDVVLMNVAMPALNGLDATRRLLAECPHVKVIALSVSADPRRVVAMFEAGATGFLAKNSTSNELADALRAAKNRQKYVSPTVTHAIVDAAVCRTAAPKPERPLSSREREVLQLISEGSSSKDIATQLSVALPTVETHRRQIMSKLGLRSVAELTKYAIREGITSVDS